MWRLDHVQLAIPEGAEERCDRFYVELLGFSIVIRPAPFNGRGGRWYQRDGAMIHLGVDPHFHPATKAHPALVVDDYQALVGVLRDSGIEIRDNCDIVGTVRCHVIDPVGNRIELIDATSLQ